MVNELFPVKPRSRCQSLACKAVNDKERRLLGQDGVGKAPGGQTVDHLQFGKYLVLVVHEECDPDEEGRSCSGAAARIF